MTSALNGSTIGDALLSYTADDMFARAVRADVARNDAEAVRWYNMASAKGCIVSTFNLANMYRDARGVPRDDVKARKMHATLTAMNYHDAMYELAWCFRKGRGGEQSFTEAMRLLRIIVEASGPTGGGLAKGLIGIMYRNGEGVPRDYVEAVKWFSEGVACDDTDSQIGLAQMYCEGWGGLSRDYAKSMQLTLLAAAKTPKWYINVGAQYNNGQGVPQNYALAVSYFEMSAAGGHAPALVLLGGHFEHGRGVKRDVYRAVDYYRRAAALDSSDALAALRRLGVPLSAPLALMPLVGASVDDSLICAVCGVAATKRCSRCHDGSDATFYCGTEHQHQHWPMHKQSCAGNRRAPLAIEHHTPSHRPSQQSCVVCGVASAQCCSGCTNNDAAPHYCGREHQRQHLAEHKEHCG